MMNNWITAKVAWWETDEESAKTAEIIGDDSSLDGTLVWRNAILNMNHVASIIESNNEKVMGLAGLMMVTGEEYVLNEKYEDFIERTMRRT